MTVHVGEQVRNGLRVGVLPLTLDSGDSLGLGGRVRHTGTRSPNRRVLDVDGSDRDPYKWYYYGKRVPTRLHV